MDTQEMVVRVATIAGVCFICGTFVKFVQKQLSN